MEKAPREVYEYTFAAGFVIQILTSGGFLKTRPRNAASRLQSSRGECLTNGDTGNWFPAVASYQQRTSQALSVQSLIPTRRGSVLFDVLQLKGVTA